MLRRAPRIVLLVAVLGLLIAGCRGDRDNLARSDVADLQTSVAALQTIAARPTATPVTPAPTPTPVLAVVVRNTNAKDTECQGDQSQLIEWSYQGNTFSACFDPGGACARLARIGAGLPAECGGVFQP